jgi:hypothetical protein
MEYEHNLCSAPKQVWRVALLSLSQGLAFIKLLVVKAWTCEYGQVGYCPETGINTWNPYFSRRSLGTLTH